MLTNKLPTTLQAMKDYIKFTKHTIKREQIRIEELQNTVVTLTQRIKEIEDQTKAT